MTILEDTLAIYDISVRLGADTILYPGDPPVGITRHCGINAGGQVNVSALSFCSHSGTHIDAPFHVNPHGRKIDELPLDIFVGTAQVIEPAVTGNVITKDALAAKVHEDTERLLIKSRNSALWQKNEYSSDYVYLSKEAAEWIARAGIRLVGIDYISPDAPGSEELPVHSILLGNSIPILEGINLGRIPEGIYQLICLPIKFSECDGAPARAVLSERSPE